MIACGTVRLRVHQTDNLGNAIWYLVAKEDFLVMPFEDRNCEVELYEDCRTRKLLKQCNCVPWEMFLFKEIVA